MNRDHLEQLWAIRRRMAEKKISRNTMLRSLRALAVKIEEGITNDSQPF